MREIAVKVNGAIRKDSIKDNTLLLDFLRDNLEVRSVKAACWRGECGLCTVLMNGRLVKSCLVLAVEADGGDVKTVEGISENGELAPIQKAFIEPFGPRGMVSLPGDIHTPLAVRPSSATSITGVV